MWSTTVLILFAVLVGTVLPLAIPKQQLKLTSYDDKFARFKMFFLAAGAYGDDARPCMKSAYPNSTIDTVSKEVEVKCAKTDYCRGFTALSHTDSAIIVSFRGTNQFVQLIQQSVRTIFGAEEFIAGGYVSRYFYKAFRSVWNGGLKEDYLNLREKYPDYEVWLTGHSLGGAMASLCAATLSHLMQADPQKMLLMTFGQPRVGDQAYAEAHEALVPHSFRVVHNLDLVPHLPPLVLPVQGLFNGYRHHKSEVWYRNSMRVGDGFRVCNDGESLKCSDGSLLPTISISDHLYYFQDDEWILNFGLDGCPIDLVSK
ncbi:hypothetical protein QR680_015879 [Steinernema hermaphroditum]|uniref:Fungal lipase-type domain-containing protein n=1 Tax=Steinernema hermaphroditum TaxID=289476 RepID=A0AA39H9A4_9BILA|nr:hypothetical protein QR680_015879 [Steinernema hermaphroditum]